VGGLQARIFLGHPPVDMRRSFDGLMAIVHTESEQDIRQGDLFVFVNKRRDRLKLLWWDDDGLAISMKRLEQATFERPRQDSTYENESELLLQMIQALYDIETRAQEMTWQQRQEVRARESSVVLAGIKKWLDSPIVRDVLPKSDFAGALRYIRNHWTALSVYVSDGRIPIDNNSVEQLMEYPIRGRKTWLLVGNHEAGEAAARLFTLTKTCS
jgi:transposase